MKARQPATLRRTVIGAGVAGVVAWTGHRREALTTAGAWAGAAVAALSEWAWTASNRSRVVSA